jgi:predicted nucleic acid-binding protein
LKAVVNSTPLIALSIIGYLPLLNILFKQVFVPISVYEEVVLQGEGRPGAEAVAQASWLRVEAPERPLLLPAELLQLDRGEQDAILLTQAIQADWVLIDERLARSVASSLGLQVKGTLGVLLIAYRLGLISREAATKAVQELAGSSVRLNPRLLEWFVAQLG